MDSSYQHKVNKPILTALATLCVSGLLLLASSATSYAQTPGISDDTIRLGASSDTEGDISYYVIPYNKGLRAAFEGVTIQKRRIQYDVLPDFYNPPRAVSNTQQLIDDGVFAFVGNVGTPTAAAVLPLLQEAQIPGIGFSTGGGFVNRYGGTLFNYPPTGNIEIETLVERALDVGLPPQNICILAQNDPFGMSAVSSVKNVFERRGLLPEVVNLLDAILAMPADSPNRNYIGPVGTHHREIKKSKDAYDSLVAWEQSTGHQCKLVVTASIRLQLVNFIAYSRVLKQRDWMFSALSVLASESVLSDLNEFGVNDGLIFTQVVPSLEADLPIVQEAREALGRELSIVSLEGYIVGKLTTALLKAIEGEITREKLIAVAEKGPYDLGGISVDFREGPVGSMLITLTNYANNAIESLSETQFKQLLDLTSS